MTTPTPPNFGAETHFPGGYNAGGDLPRPQPREFSPGGSTAMTCMICGQQGTLRPGHKDITRKRRVKFGLFWLLFSIVTGGLGFLLYLVWPRHAEIISTDRFVICTNCGSKQ